MAEFSSRTYTSRGTPVGSPQAFNHAVAVPAILSPDRLPPGQFEDDLDLVTRRDPGRPVRVGERELEYPEFMRRQPRPSTAGAQRRIGRAEGSQQRLPRGEADRDRCLRGI